MCKKIEMKFEDMEQVSGGMTWTGSPYGLGVINPNVEPIVPGMPIPWFPVMPNPIAGK